VRWFARLFRKSRAERELDQELRFHLEQQSLDNSAAGMSPEEARRDAFMKLGGIERVKEEVRDTRWEIHLDNLFRDFRYALRNLRNDRRFSLIAIFALALGIGASTIVFSVVYNVFSTPFLIGTSTGGLCLKFTIQRTSAHRKAARTSHLRNSVPFANKIMSSKT